MKGDIPVVSIVLEFLSLPIAKLISLGSDSSMSSRVILLINVARPVDFFGETKLLKKVIIFLSSIVLLVCLLIRSLLKILDKILQPCG